VHSRSFARSSALQIRIRSRHVATFWVSDLLEVLLRLGSGSRSRAILPALSPHDVTRVGDPGELGPLPLGYFSLEGAQHVGWDFRARVGAARRRPRSFRPMSAAHGCCFQRRSPHVSAHVASPCSHTMRELAVSRRNARFGEPSDRVQGVVFPRPPIRRRTSDAPSPAGSPGGAMSADVGPRSLARSQVVPESLGPLDQAA
jgi:hypothetical protein